jgi:hypothetical protein
MHSFIRSYPFFHSFIPLLPDACSSSSSAAAACAAAAATTTAAVLLLLCCCCCCCRFSLAPIGESGEGHHLATSFLLADSINHGIELRKYPVLEYLCVGPACFGRPPPPAPPRRCDSRASSTAGLWATCCPVRLSARSHPSLIEECVWFCLCAQSVDQCLPVCLYLVTVSLSPSVFLSPSLPRSRCCSATTPHRPPSVSPTPSTSTVVAAPRRYYLAQIGLGLCPLSNDALFLKLKHSPIPSFIRRGLNVSLRLMCVCIHLHTCGFVLGRISRSEKPFHDQPASQYVCLHVCGIVCGASVCLCVDVSVSVRPCARARRCAAVRTTGGRHTSRAGVAWRGTAWQLGVGPSRSWAVASVVGSSLRR